MAVAFAGLLFLSSAASAATLTHRWSFNTDYKDSVTDTAASPIGAYYELVDGQLVLRGDGSNTGSMNLGYNLLDTSEATLELWVTQNELQWWSRVFDYASSKDNNLFAGWSFDDRCFHSRVEAKVGGTATTQDNAIGPYKLGVKYHIAVTFQENTSANTTTVRFMRRNSKTGALEKDWTMTVTGLLSSFSNPGLYIGKSIYGGTDRDAHASYDEVRTWSGILSDDRLEANAVRGPDDTTPGEALSLTGPAYATWIGTSAPESAEDIENSANWSCTDASGTAVADVVPGTATTVIIPVSDASYFTIPTGYTPNWRAVRFGPEHAGTEWAWINYGYERSGMAWNTDSWVVFPQANYMRMGRTDDPSGCLVTYGLEKRQYRFDGWFYVTAAEAGKWSLETGFDDYFTVLIDGVIASFNPTWNKSFTHKHYVSAGWHRYTITCGDTYGGWATSIDTPTVTLPDSSTKKFLDFTRSTAEAGTIKLATDCNWGAFGTITLTSGVKVDLNGHNLIVDDITSDYIGTMVTNSSDSASTMYYSVDPSSSVGANELIVAASVNKAKATSYIWTGNAGDCKTSTLGNWRLLSGVVPTEAPNAETPLVFEAAAGGIVTNDVEGLGGEGVSFAASAGAFTIVGNAFTNVTVVGNASANVQTLSNEVYFAGTYLVSLTSTAVNFAGGATASEPDSSLRYAGSSDLLRTLVGNFTFTDETWYVANLGNNDYPWIVPSGSTVTANNLIGQQTYATRMLSVAEGATVHVSYIEIGWDRGDIEINGTLIVDGTLKVITAGTSKLGRSGTTGTIQANQVVKSGGGYADIYHPNYIVGSGGVGNISGAAMSFYGTDAVIKASDDFSFVAADNSGIAISSGRTLTLDTNGHTIWFGVPCFNPGSVIKTGDGTLIMTNGYDGVAYTKTYTGGTVVNGGVLYIAASDSVGTGAITVNDGGTLQIADGVTFGNAIVLNEGAVYDVDAGVTNFVSGSVSGSGTAQINGQLTIADGGLLDIGTYELGENASIYVAAQSSDRVVATNVTSEVFAKFTSPGKLTLGDGGAVSYSEAYVWIGADGGSWSDAANWSHNGNDGELAPVDAPTGHVIFNGAATVVLDAAATVYDITFEAGDGEVVINNPAAVDDVVTTNMITLTKVSNTGTAVPVINCAIGFTGTYLVSFTSAAVNFAGGATATCPDGSLRYAGGPDLIRTLVGNFTFTNDWIAAELGGGDAGNRPWIIPNGTVVHAGLFTGLQSSHMRILEVQEGGSAYFTVVTNGWDRGNLDIDGYMEVSNELVLRTCPSTKDWWASFGADDNTGTVKANAFKKVEHSPGAFKIPNLVVGAGGIGSVTQDYSLYIYKSTTITAAEDFEFMGVYSSANTDDWGIRIINSSALTVNAPEDITVTCGIGVQGDGSIVKTGEGTLVMTGTYNGTSGFTKTYSGGTTVNGGTLRIAASGSIGSNTITINDGGTVEVASGASVVNTNAVNNGGTLKLADSADVLYGTAILAAGSTVEFGGTNVVYGAITAPESGTATIKFIGEYVPSANGTEYTLANNFSGDVSNLLVDKTGMTNPRVIAKLGTKTKDGSTKLVLQVFKGGFRMYLR